MLRALGHILRLHILRRLLQLLTAYRIGAGEAGGRNLGEEGVQRGVCLRERGRIGEDHCAPSKKKEKVSK